MLSHKRAGAASGAHVQQHSNLTTAPRHSTTPRQQRASTTAAAAAPDGSQQCTAAAAASVAAAATLVLQTCLPVQPAAAAAALQQQQAPPQQHAQRWQPALGDLAFLGMAAAPAAEAGDAADGEDMTLQEIEADIMADVALPPELRSFMELLQKGPVKSPSQLSAARRAVGFERTPDGRVLLLSEDGEPFQVKPDMGVPGALLLRDAGGYLYYIPPSDNDSLVQIDLSDDAIVAQLFANHAWEELVEPLEIVRAGGDADGQGSGGLRSKAQLAKESVGRLEQLRLSERQFRGVISLLSGSQQLPEEALEDLDGQEQQ